jgi:FKBP-type peptidyl-prolyl cis-trans isomerase
MPRDRPNEPLAFTSIGLSFCLLVGVCYWTARAAPPPADARAQPEAPPPAAARRAPDARPVDASEQMLKVTTVAGKGPAVRLGDRVTVRYRLESGASGKREFTVGQGQVMRAWDEGVVGMQAGEKRRLAAPPAMSAANDLVPAGGSFKGEIELLTIGGGTDLE